MGEEMEVKLHIKLEDLDDLKEVLKKLDEIKKETPNVNFNVDVMLHVSWQKNN